MNIKKIILFISLITSINAYSATEIVNTNSNECVILLHGILRTEATMQKMSSELEKQGYATVNQGYPSTKYKIERLSITAISTALKKCPVDTEKVHFIGYSMGGLLIRYYLSNNQLPKLGRVVMLGTPNQGSEVADTFKNQQWYKTMYGPAGQQLVTKNNQFLEKLAPINYELGIIAGSQSIDPVSSTVIPNRDDGKVSIASTKVKGMKQHIVLPVNHTFMVLNHKVISDVISFLAKGEF